VAEASDLPVTLSPMSAQESAGKPSSRGFLLALAALAWLAAMLWAARDTITGRANAEMEVTSTAYALPGAVSAALVAGATVGLAVLTLITARRPLPATLRFAVATGGGLAVGLLGAVPIVTINTEGWVYAVVGGTVAAAATIGGALAGFRAPRVVAATGWASITVFLTGFVLNLNQVQDPVIDLLGGGDTAASQASAAQWFTFCQSLLSGLAAGLVSFVVMRRARSRDGADVPWPLYALAGAGPGLLLVIAEGLTRTAGARVLDLAGRVSDLERVVQQMLSGARFNSALIVLFAGAITAVIAVGRTMSPAPDESDDEPPAPGRDETESDLSAKARDETESGPSDQVSSSNSETAYHSSS
jgi:iron complex transport system permease protein